MVIFYLTKIGFNRKIVLTEGIDVAKSKNRKEYIACHYWYFDHGFKN